MYHSHFGLKEAPFSIKVNPSFLFMTQKHKDALATLLYGASSEGGFALLTGEIGTGKTTLIRALLQQLPSDVDTALVLNPALNPIELLATICDELKIEYGSDEQNLKSLTDKLHHYLLERHAQGRGVVVLIDEAQHLKFEALEQIRLLTNLETDTRKLLQIILVGQPELDTKLSEPELKQLAQRITARFHLGTLTLAEAQAYVRHRLQVAGLAPTQTLFPEALVERIHSETDGVPRLINILCDRILLGAYARNTSTLDNELLDTARAEVFGQQTEPAERKASRHTAVNVIAMLSLAAIAIFAFFRDTGNTTTSNTAEVADTNAQVAGLALANDEQLTTETPVAPLQAVEEAQPWWESAYRDEAAALNALLRQRELIDEFVENPCTDIEADAIACQQAVTEAWPELLSHNRIAVIQLLTPSKFYRYVPLLGLRDDAENAELADVLMLGESGDAEQATVPMAELGSLWTGRSTLLWAVPKGFSKPVGLGSQGNMVSWVAKRFAQLDKQDAALADRRFNRALSERVKLFQRRHKLEDDGIVGMQTALKLSDALNEHTELKLSRPNGGGN